MEHTERIDATRAAELRLAELRLDGCRVVGPGGVIIHPAYLLRLLRDSRPTIPVCEGSS